MNYDEFKTAFIASLKDSGLPIISANNMAEAAERVVAAAKGN